MFHVSEETIRAEVAKLSTKELKRYLWIDQRGDVLCEEDGEYYGDEEEGGEENDFACDMSSSKKIGKIYDIESLKNGIVEANRFPSLVPISDFLKGLSEEIADIGTRYKAEALRRYVCDHLHYEWGEWVSVPRTYVKTWVCTFKNSSQRVLEIDESGGFYRWSFALDFEYLGYGICGKAPSLEAAQASAQEAFDNRIAAILRGEG